RRRSRRRFDPALAKKLVALLGDENAQAVQAHVDKGRAETIIIEGRHDFSKYYANVCILSAATWQVASAAVPQTRRGPLPAAKVRKSQTPGSASNFAPRSRAAMRPGLTRRNCLSALIMYFSTLLTDTPSSVAISA